MVRAGEFFRGDVLVRDGSIIGITHGPATDVTAAAELDASDGLVLPGFVQAHVHVVQSLLRHRADQLELLDWLRLKTWPYEAALDGDDVQAAAELGIAELLTGGTTAALDFGTTHDHDRVFEVARSMGIRLVSGKTHMDMGEDVPRVLLEDTDRSLAEAEALGHRWHGQAGGRLRYAVTPRFALSCTHDLLTRCAWLARENGWLLQTHAAENRNETANVRAITGFGNIAYLDSVGLTGPDVVLAHGIHLEPGETDLLTRTRTTICHCPGANLKLASGIADVPALLEAGVKVAIGADGPPCNNRLSIFHEMSLAGTLHNLRHGPAAIDPWQVLAMATREGARAIGIGDMTGTLEPGKAADLVVLDGRDWSLLPEADPASRIVYGAGVADVRHVLVDGRILVNERQLQSADPTTIRMHVAMASEAVAARMHAEEVN